MEALGGKNELGSVNISDNYMQCPQQEGESNFYVCLFLWFCNFVCITNYEVKDILVYTLFFCRQNTAAATAVTMTVTRAVSFAFEWRIIDFNKENRDGDREGWSRNWSISVNCSEYFDIKIDCASIRRAIARCLGWWPR